MAAEPNKKLLIISYFAPPQNVPGAVRVGKLARYLPNWGWDATILTVQQNDYFCHDPLLYPDDLNVVRTATFDVFTLQKLKKRFGSASSPENSLREITTQKEGLVKNLKKYLPLDDKIGWMPAALWRALELHRRYRFSCVFTTLGGVFHTAITTWLFSKITGVPYILDFRDLWSGNPLNEQSRLVRNINTALEKRVVKDAAAVIGVTPSTTAFLQQYSSTPKFHTITNGFDPADFSHRQRIPEDRLVMTFCGSIYTRISPKILFQSILEAGESYPITIRFVGNIRGNATTLIQHYASLMKKLDVQIEQRAKVPYHQLVEMMATSDVLLAFLPDDTAESGVILPAKIFDYIGADRPVLAFCPAGGDLAKLINEGNLGFAVASDDVNRGSATIKQLVEMHRTGVLAQHTCIPAFRNTFDRNRIAQKVAEVCNEIRTGA